ncbi:MAG TPA: hypothetical protein DEF07_04415 [Nitrosomonas sp.]|nr:hypothetical protein [Nitrosomonas sp.]HNP52867.1 hypothetical protein [Nitrosomonas nitrosa]
MGGDQTKNAALTTALAFHYQFLIGLYYCFTMSEGQSIWFERDGDVSLIGETIEDSTQTEVKDYSDALTDHHENFWKTLRNWLTPEFKHKNYSSLVLHTTQAFGVMSSLRDWNEKTVDERMKIIKAICATRTPKELSVDKPKPIVQYQKSVIAVEEDKLRAVLAKVVLITQADDVKSVREKIQGRLIGIPKNNQTSYLEGIVGFVYGSADNKQWEISKCLFDQKCEELTSVYCRKQFTIPAFTGREATEKELALHEEKLFVEKIQCIEYEDVIPEAVGNWIELHNSLNEELDGAPQFRNTANQYQSQLVKQFKHKYSKEKRNCSDIIRSSQNLYDDVIGEAPTGTEGYQSPPIEYKNGLIHDAMDNDELKLQWKVKP